MKPRLNGFEIQGLDRSKREGGVLGIYLFFDDRACYETLRTEYRSIAGITLRSFRQRAHVVYEQ
jgi:hypothetical protein